MQLNNHENLSHSSSSSSSAESSPVSRSTSRRQSTVSSKESPKMSTPLWIKLSGELLMAPKKKVTSKRRFTMAKTTTTADGASVMSVQADGSTVKTVGDSRRSTRPRSRICRDLFGAKMSQVQQIRG